MCGCGWHSTRVSIPASHCIHVEHELQLAGWLGAFSGELPPIVSRLFSVSRLFRYSLVSFLSLLFVLSLALCQPHCRIIDCNCPKPAIVFVAFGSCACSVSLAVSIAGLSCATMDSSPIDARYEDFEAPRYYDFSQLDTEDDSGVDQWFGMSKQPTTTTTTRTTKGLASCVQELC
jgi:hypothetical protein